jgi:hypothetical protein
MSDTPEPGNEVEVLDPAPDLTPETILPPGVQPSRNYVAAIELGTVLAQSGIYKDALEPARAAVKVMIGMDLGLSPTAALQGIHVIEDRQGKVSIIIEGKLFAALIKGRPGYDFRFTPVDPEDPSKGTRRSDTEVSIDFYKDGEKVEPSIVWTIERAKKAGLTKNDTYTKYPAEMLTWRALAEGARIHFPELLAGNPIYAEGELGEEGDLRKALEPPKAQPLTDAKAEGLREKAREVFDQLRAINPDRLVSGRFAQALAGAEHSHAALEAKVAWLEDLRDTEKTVGERKAELEALVGDKEAKGTIERAERRGSNRERIDVLDKAIGLEREKAEGQEGGEGDGA